MKRFALILAVVGASALFGTASANAADKYYGQGYQGYNSYGHGNASYGRSPRHGNVGYGYLAPAYGHRVVPRVYVAPAYGGHGYYPSRGHSRAIRISTPYFGLRIGH